MKRIHACFFLLLLAVAGGALSEERVYDGVAAYVNDRTITVGDALVAMEPVRRQLDRKYGGEELREQLRRAYAETVESLVERQLILDAFEKQKAALPEWLVERRMAEIQRDAFGDDRGALASALAEDRLTYDEWREQIRKNLIISSMLASHVDQKAKVPPSSVRSAYEKERESYRTPALVRLRIIEISKGSGEGAALRRKLAEDVRKKAAAGEDFGALAREYSEGLRKDQGGDWGWIDPSQTLRKELADAASRLKPSEVSPVIDTGDAMYILKVEGRKESGIAPFEDVAPQIERKLRQEVTGQVRRTWVAGLKQSAWVKVCDVSVF